jgi:dipeptidyl-peptidase 4
MLMAMFIAPGQGAGAAAMNAALPPSSCGGVDLPTKIKNGLVIPHWIAGSDNFWYRRQTAVGAEFNIVEPGRAKIRPAFDHTKIAQALKDAGAGNLQADALPIDDLQFSAAADSTTITIGTREYDCSLKEPRCASREATVREGSLAPNGTVALLSIDGNLWLRDIKSGQMTRLTADGMLDAGYGIAADTYQSIAIPRKKARPNATPMQAYWSPDSTRVVVNYIDQRDVKPYPYVEFDPSEGGFRPKAYSLRIPLLGERRARYELHIFDLVKKTHVKLNFPYEHLIDVHTDILPVRELWWSENGARIFALAHGANMEAAYLFDVDPGSGGVHVLIDEHDSPWTDLNSTSYNQPNVRVIDGDEDIIWYSQRSGWGHLYLYDARTGRLKNAITQGNWLVRDIVAVDRRTRTIFFTGSGRETGNPYYRYLYSVHFDGSGLHLLTPEPADHLITAMGNDFSLGGSIGYSVLSPDGKYIVYNTSPLGKPGTTTLRTADGKLVLDFEKMDITELRAAGYRAPEEFVVKAADGVTDLWGILYRPAGLDPTRKYPVIDDQYASPLLAATPRNYLMAVSGPDFSPVPRPGALSQCGFAVISIDARGTTGRSKEFSRAQYHGLSTMGLEDHIAAIHQLAQRYPWLDADRVGIYGLSYGGWTTLRAMLKFPKFFKAGVAGVPPGDWTAVYPDYEWTQYEGLPVYPNGSNEKSSPGEVPLNYQQLSSTALADRLAGRLMLVVAGLDENVLPGSPLQFADALMDAHKDFEMVFLPRANHYSGWDDYLARRIVKFFQRAFDVPDQTAVQ